ncbi:hypothetical protein GCM10023143_25780 [Compostibacter hankyongensis]|uniref:Thioredoxin domain-containing protein n=2 Tax=Compostibacter hankyongensis TaxID=1007089 RepID=A0ABP8G0E2_9BACT
MLRENNDQAALTAALDAAPRTREARVAVYLKFVRTHPDSQASGDALRVIQSEISWRELESLYQGLSEEVRNSKPCRNIPYTIAAGKRTDIGRPAPDFTLADVKGDSVKLSSLRGKYVLLDFWASWCKPCRAENPYILKAYRHFKDRGFTVLGVSRDEDSEKWKAAVREDGMPWQNTIDRQPWEKSVIWLYGVYPIPDNFLIDPSGKIIARDLRGDDLEKKLAEVMN